MASVITVAAQNTNYGKLPDGDWYPGYNKGSQSTNQPDACLGAATVAPAPVRTNKSPRLSSSSLPASPDTTDLPDHWDNSQQPYFPPVFSQGSFGSCGVSSHVGYMMTSEMNAAQNTNGKLEANQLCPMFEYTFTYHGPGKDDMALDVGYPSADVYGGRYPGSKYGGYEYTSGVAGWMQGYDSWLNAMKHRIASASNYSDPSGNMYYATGKKYSTNPATPGFKLIKGYLHSHNGDPNFGGRGGVLCMGVGIASSALATVPSTPTNDHNSLTGKKYMLHWNTGSGDHAMTIVGYDDRIQFDLDGNGIAGETNNRLGQNENGAWILVNTWGQWANSGFVYAPYAQGGGISVEKTLPAPKNSTAVQAYNADDPQTVEYDDTKTVTVYPAKWFWEPYAYHYRIGYTPQRTMKITMEYVHRSEISVVVGIAQDTTATQPEKTFTFPYMNYQGDGTGNDPATPLLGQWADGQMHYEPMEFGIDLTDLSDGFDNRKPLKYFLIVNSNSDASKAQGHGQIISASVIDYEFDSKGVETPFPQRYTNIQNGGAQTVITTIVNGEQLNAPMNTVINGSTIAWDKPAASSYAPTKYYIYKGGVLTDSVDAPATSKDLASTSGTWTVKAVYEVNGGLHLSGASNEAIASSSLNKDEAYDNSVLSLTNGGFYVPDVVSSKHSQYTVEFWFKPTNLHNWGDYLFNHDWGSRYRVHTSAAGTIAAGWDTNTSTGDRINAPAGSLANNRWNHIALVIDGQNHKIYVDGEKVAEATTTNANHSGLPAFWSGRLYFGDQKTLNGKIDELRLWTTARTADEIKGNMRTPVLNPSQKDNLAAYFRGEVYKEQYSDDKGITQTRWRIKDSAQGHDAYFIDGVDSAALHQDTVATGATISTAATVPDVTITAPDTVSVGESVTFGYSGSVGITGFVWTTTDAQTESTTAAKPSFVFDKGGEKTVRLTATDISGQTATAEKNIYVSSIEPNAGIILSADTINTGDVISFISRNRAPNCTYKWEWDDDGTGSSNSSTMANASARYNNEGVKNVKLTVTAADGKVYSGSRTFHVILAAPVEGHQVSPIVILKGDTVTLTDKSSNQPTSGEWDFLSRSSLLRMDSLSGHIYPKNSGVYTLTHTVANRIGSVTGSAGRALIVCNDESYNGLSFYGANNQTMKFQLPSTTGITSDWAIDFWFNPSDMTSSCAAITAVGDDESNALKLTSNAVGGLTLATTDKNSELSGVYTANEWHHYAISASGSTVTVYRDATRIGTLESSQTDYSSILKNITIGGDNSRMSIDELCVWNKALTVDDIKSHANQRITKTDSLRNEGLLAYFNFNYNDGETLIADSSGNDVTATLTGFDQTYAFLSPSKGVFSLDLNTPENEQLVGVEIPRQRFKVVAYSDSHPTEGAPANVIDGNASTYWHSQYQSSNTASVGYPHSITFSRVGNDTIRSLQIYYARGDNYRAANLTVEESADSANWTKLDVNHYIFSFSNQNVQLIKPATEKYVKLTFNSGHGQFLCINEITFYGSRGYLYDLSKAHGAYTVVPKDSARGVLYAKPFDDQYVTSCGGTVAGVANADIATDESDPYQQWAFVSNGEKYYMYNIGTHKFAKAPDDGQTDNADYATLSKTSASEVSITGADNGYVTLTLGGTKSINFTRDDRTYLTASELRDGYSTLRIALLGVTTTGDHYINGEAGTGHVSTTGKLADAAKPTATDVLRLESDGSGKFYLKRESDGKYFSVAQGKDIQLVDDKTSATAFNIYGKDDADFGSVSSWSGLYSDIAQEANEYMVRFVADGQYLNGQSETGVGGLRAGTGAWSFQYVRNVIDAEVGCKLQANDNDDGNMLRLVQVPAAVFSKTDSLQAVRQLTETVDDHTVTYTVNVGDKVVKRATASFVNGAWLPKSIFPGEVATATNDFIALGVTSAQVTRDTTVVAGCYTGPVQFSTSYADAKWYRLNFESDRNRSIAYNPNNVNTATGYGYVHASNTWDNYADNSLWAFFGSPYGVRLVNKAAGAGKVLAYVSGRAVMQDSVAGQPDTELWEMHASNKGFALNSLGSSGHLAYLNNRSHTLGCFNGSDGYTWANSRIYPTLASYPATAFSTLPTNANTRWGQPAVKSASGKNIVDLVSAYAEKPSEESFSAVIAGIDGYKFGVDPATGFAGSDGYVNISNSGSSANVSLVFGGDANDAALTQSTDNNSISQLWQVTSEAAGKVRLYNANTEKYLGEATTTSASLSADPVEWNIRWTSDSTFTLSNGTDRLGSASATAGSLAIGMADSTWTFANVKSVSVPLRLIGNYTYASAYLPFAAAVSGASVYAQASVNGGTLTLTKTDPTVTAKTPFILVGSKDSTMATFLIVDDADATSSAGASGDNPLRGTLTPMAWNYDSYLTLGWKDNAAGFYKYNMTELAANHAYIDASSVSSSAKGLTINIDGGEATGIDHVVIDESQSSDKVYNILGQRLDRPRRGINIINGSKVLVK